MLHLKLPNVDKGKGPRLLYDAAKNIVVTEDEKNPSISHVQIQGLNYCVDSNFDDTVKELGLELEKGGDAAAA